MSKTDPTGSYRIFAMGNPEDPPDGFDGRADLENYIRGEVFSLEEGRYRQTAVRDADIIVLSRDGYTSGHFFVQEWVSPTLADKKAYAKVRRTYIISRAVAYENEIRLYPLGVRVRQTGAPITADQFQMIISLAGKLTPYTPRVSIASDDVSASNAERLAYNVSVRLRQGEFREQMLQLYNRICVVTGCTVVQAIQACHINPWCESKSNIRGNGLILRSDIHLLFDANLIAIEPKTLKVHVSEQIANTEYSAYHLSHALMPESSKRVVDRDALAMRWLEFRGQT